VRVGLCLLVMALFPLRLASAQAETDSCVPTAVLIGEDGLVGELEDELVELGVATERRGTCPASQAQVTRTPQGVAVVLRDSLGRVEQRVLSDLAVAAAWIDSWLRPEIDPLSFAAFPSAPAPAPAAPPPPAAPAASLGKVAPASSAGLLPFRSHLGIAYEWSKSDLNSETWQGVRADACLFLGRACLGLVARYADNLRTTPVFETDGIQHERDYGESEYYGGAMIEVPFQLAQARVVPRANIGYGFYSFRAPSEIICYDDPEVGCVDESNSYTRRNLNAEVGLSISLPVTGWLAIDLGGSLDVRPLADRSVSYDSGAPCVDPPMPGDPDMPNDPVPNDPACMDKPIPATAVEGQPTRLWRFGLGLRVEL
jgi:hypothetical protein